MTTREDRQALADRLIAAGADPAAARREAGLPDAPAPRSRSKSKRSRRSKRRRGPRLKPPRVQLAPASSFGSIFAQMLGLVLLYWVIRSAGAVDQILTRIGSAVRWFVDPVGWGRQSQTNR